MPGSFPLLSDPGPASREPHFPDSHAPGREEQRGQRGDKAGAPLSHCLWFGGGMKGVYPNPTSADPGASRSPRWRPGC